MWLLVPALALGGLRADVDAAARTSPDMALVCTSAQEAWSRLGRLVLAMEGAGGTPLPPEVRALFSSPEAAGLFEAGARLDVSFWKEAQALEVGFDSTRSAKDVAHALAGLDPTGGTRAVAGLAEAWTLQGPEGAVARVLVDRGRARFVRGDPPEDAARIVPKALVDRMPEDAGCVALMHTAEQGMGDLDVAVHVAFAAGQPATFAVAGPSVEAFRGVVFDPAVPPEMRTAQVPQGVVVLGVGIDGVDFSSFLGGKALRRARRVQNAFPVGAGTTIALMGSDPAPVFGAVLPLPEDMRAKRVARKAKRLAKSQHLPVQKLDKTHFTIDAGAMRVYAGAQDGRLLVANDPGVLGAMEGAQGAPWVQGRAAELAARYPLVITSTVLPGGAPGQTMDEPFSFAVDLKPGLLSGELDVPLTIEELAAFARAMEASGAAPMEGAPPVPEEETPAGLPPGTPVLVPVEPAPPRR